MKFLIYLFLILPAIVLAQTAVPVNQTTNPMPQMSAMNDVCYFGYTAIYDSLGRRIQDHRALETDSMPTLVQWKIGQAHCEDCPGEMLLVRNFTLLAPNYHVELVGIPHDCPGELWDECWFTSYGVLHIQLDRLSQPIAIRLHQRNNFSIEWSSRVNTPAPKK